MVELGSLIGFALVFVTATWLTSTLLCTLLLLGRARLRSLGPRAERRAASIALVLPVAVGAALTAGLVGLSAFGPSLGLEDHCLAHDHHLHLCLRHGADWLTRWWAVVLITGVSGLLAARVVRALHEWWNVARRLRAVRAVSSDHAMTDGTIVVRAPSRQPFCFTAGVRSPRIYVSSATLDHLDDAQQRAVVAHERAHVTFGDLRRGSVLSILALLGAPGLAASAMRVWGEASERLCDRVAADAVGSPVAVASAILAFARAPACSTGCSFVPHCDHIADRVEAVLGNSPIGQPVARHLVATAAVAYVLLAVAAVALANPLHHAIETLLGSL